MAARLAPDNVRRVHQSLHHLVSTAGVTRMPSRSRQNLRLVGHAFYPARTSNFYLSSISPTLSMLLMQLNE